MTFDSSIMMPPSFLAEENFAKNLGISLDLWKLLQARIEDKKLKASVVKETGSGSFSITLEYEPCRTENISVNGGKRTIVGSRQTSSVSHVKPAPTTFSPKKKSPSRRRRDRERFRKFLEQKKKRKQTAKSPQQPQDSQLSLNSNTPHQPTVTPPQSRRPLSDTACKEVEQILSSPSPENFCGPFLEKHYDDCACAACTSEPSYDTMANVFCDLRNCCSWCGAPPCDVAGGLKKCTQCKCVAYCSKP